MINERGREKFVNFKNRKIKEHNSNFKNGIEIF